MPGVRKLRFILLFRQGHVEHYFRLLFVNLLTPNDPYMGRTAPLTSKRCILYIYSTNIGTEYFKHALYSQFFLFKMQFFFHNANLFGSCVIHILYTGCATIKKKSGAKGFISPSITPLVSIPVAALSKARVCGRSLVGIAGSSPAGGVGCLHFVSVVCSQEEVSASAWSLVQRNITECGVSECDREASIMRRPLPTSGCCAMEKKYPIRCYECGCLLTNEV